VELSEDEERLALAVFDPITYMAETDSAILDELLRDVNTGEAALQALLAELAEDAGLYQEKEVQDVAPQVDKAEELRQKWQVETGQLWQLGEHRLICGDCTDAAVVTRVMDGERINVAVTSPPYASQRKYDESSGFKPIAPSEYVDWFSGVQASVATHLADDGSWFVNIKEHCEDGQRHLYVKDLAIAHVRAWAWLLVDEFCWLRSGYPGGWDNRFKNGFEPVYHFSKHADIKFRPQGVSVPGITKKYDGKDTRGVSGMSNRSGGVGHKVEGLVRPSNVLDYKEPVHGGEHAAPFPVSLPTFFINAFSDDSDIIYEPFSGSGTTIIACEQLGRKCRAVEISPAYVAVALQRWADATGKTPVLLTN
jgi:site-specific DNA-methyltransferase (adenine-specific)